MTDRMDYMDLLNASCGYNALRSCYVILEESFGDTDDVKDILDLLDSRADEVNNSIFEELAKLTGEATE